MRHKGLRIEHVTSSVRMACVLAYSQTERYQPPVNIHPLLLRNHHDPGHDHVRYHARLYHHDLHFRLPYASGSAGRM